MILLINESVALTILLRLEVTVDEVRAVDSTDLSCMAPLLLLKLNVKLLAPLELLSLPLCAAFRLCLNKQNDELVDFNFDTNSSPDSLLSSGEQFSV